MFGIKDTVEADLNKHFSRYEDPLWDEDESNKASIEVKRVSTKNFEKHSWRIFENSKLAVVVDSEVLTKKQINFLLTMDGIKFLVDTYKNGNRNVTRIKKELVNLNAKNKNRKQ